MMRRWIYRDDSPAAWRLELADDGMWTFGLRIYAGDDTIEQTASGRWQQREGILHLAVTHSDCSLLPAGKEAQLRGDVGASLILRGCRLEPDMPLRYSYAEDKELWTLEYHLVLSRDGTYELTRQATGHAGNGEMRLSGTWELTADALRLTPEGDLATTLNRLDGDAFDLAGARLEPVDQGRG